MNSGNDRFIKSPSTFLKNPEIISLNEKLSYSQQPAPTLLKMDIQGSEPSVLRDLKSHFENWAREQILPILQIELSPHHIENQGSSIFDIFSFIDTFKYHAFLILWESEASSEPRALLRPLSFQHLLFLTHELRAMGQELGRDLLLIPSNWGRWPQLAKVLPSDFLQNSLQNPSIDTQTCLRSFNEMQQRQTIEPEFIYQLQNQYRHWARHDIAAAILQQGLLWYPQHPLLLQAQSIDLLRSGHWQQGLRQDRLTRQFSKWGAYARVWDKPMAGEQINNQTVLLVGEGGCGDEILHSRFAKHLKSMGAKKILWLTQFPELQSLLSSNADIDEVLLHEPNNYDVWSASIDLCLNYQIAAHDLWNGPYLKSTQTPFPQANEFRVGLRWKGNKETDEMLNRHLNEEELIRLINKLGQQIQHSFPNKVPKFYSFQDRANDASSLDSTITPFASLLTDWQTTANYLDQMDYVVSTCTAVAHLAGALGKPGLILTSNNPYYTWLSQINGRNAWYPSLEVSTKQDFFKQ